MPDSDRSEPLSPKALEPAVDVRGHIDTPRRAVFFL
jgi:hypothetical protein